MISVGSDVHIHSFIEVTAFEKKDVLFSGNFPKVAAQRTRGELTLINGAALPKSVLAFKELLVLVVMALSLF